MGDHLWPELSFLGFILAGISAVVVAEAEVTALWWNLHLSAFQYWNLVIGWGGEGLTADLCASGMWDWNWTQSSSICWNQQAASSEKIIHMVGKKKTSSEEEELSNFLQGGDI